MRAVIANEYGPIEVLHVGTVPDPAPAPGRVIVRIAAATVNPVDAATRAGAFAHYVPDLPMPFGLGWDFAGTVVADGDDFAAGDRVAGMIPWFALGDGVGAAAELIAADPSWIARVPAGLDDVTAATVPLNGLTARQAVDELAAAPDDRVVVTGASGAVGGFAAQLLVAAGTQVIAVASRGDEAYVAGLGVQHVVSRDPDGDLAAAIAAVAPDGVDAVLDPGAAGEELLALIRDGGTHLTSTAPVPDPGRGIRLTRVEVTPAPDQLHDLLEAVGRGALTTRVAGVLPLDDVAEAHRRIEAGGVRGKLVLTP